MNARTSNPKLRRTPETIERMSAAMKRQKAAETPEVRRAKSLHAAMVRFHGPDYASKNVVLRMTPKPKLRPKVTVAEWKQQAARNEARQ